MGWIKYKTHEKNKVLMHQPVACMSATGLFFKVNYLL